MAIRCLNAVGGVGETAVCSHGSRSRIDLFSALNVGIGAAITGATVSRMKVSVLFPHR